MVVDFPAFTPSEMAMVAPEIPLPVVLSVTVPLSEKVAAVGVGVGVGVVGVFDVGLLSPPHETPTSTTMAINVRVFQYNNGRACAPLGLNMLAVRAIHVPRFSDEVLTFYLVNVGRYGLSH